MKEDIMAMLILLSFIFMLSAVLFALAAWRNHDLRIIDVLNAAVSVLAYGAITWTCILG
jgi:hypothetical protein